MMSWLGELFDSVADFVFMFLGASLLVMGVGAALVLLKLVWWVLKAPLW